MKPATLLAGVLIAWPLFAQNSGRTAQDPGCRPHGGLLKDLAKTRHFYEDSWD